MSSNNLISPLQPQVVALVYLFTLPPSFTTQKDTAGNL